MTPADEAVFQALNNHFGGQLDLIQFFGNGSTARVFHVKYPVGSGLSLKVDRIIKVFRHDSPDIDFPGLEKVFLEEVTALIAMSHSNIISIYAAGALQVDAAKTPFYVMAYIPGACDLDVWLKGRGDLRAEDVISLFIDICSGLQALHDAHRVHCDVKFANLIVGSDRRVAIADLGFSRLIRRGREDTLVTTTLHALPNKYKHCIQHLENPRQTLVSVPRDEVDATFDLHYVGYYLRRTLELPTVAAALDETDVRSLELIIRRTNLDDNDAPLPRYKQAAELAADLTKLLPAYLSRSGVRELSPYTGTRTIRIPISGSIPFSPRVERVISHPLFLRLHNAFQLGLTYFVFPGATHTRFEHSLGVFANVARYISSLLADDYHPYFRQMVDEQKIATTLLAGLVHDVGQNSFAHTLEDLGLVRNHEATARAFITGEGSEEVAPEHLLRAGPLGDAIGKAWGEVDIGRLLWMIGAEPMGSLEADVGWEMMRSIINGPIDADKTDYLLRDAHHAGVEYARSIDLVRFMNSLSAGVVRDNLGSRGVVAITWKGEQSAENIMLARAQMFWVLYWHHAVRSAHGTMGECCYEYLREASERARKTFMHTLYCGTTGELLALLEGAKQERVRELAGLLRRRQLYKRGIELDYKDDEVLYNKLLALRDQRSANGDPLMLAVAERVADEANKCLERAKSATRVLKTDVMIDVPKATKDRLGSIYVVDRDPGEIRAHTSRAMAGRSEDWQNRIRTIRVFFNPRIGADDRRAIRKDARTILTRL